MINTGRSAIDFQGSAKSVQKDVCFCSSTSWCGRTEFARVKTAPYSVCHRHKVLAFLCSLENPNLHTHSRRLSRENILVYLTKQGEERKCSNFGQHFCQRVLPSRADETSCARCTIWISDKQLTSKCSGTLAKDLICNLAQNQRLCQRLSGSPAYALHYLGKLCQVNFQWK